MQGSIQIQYGWMRICNKILNENTLLNSILNFWFYFEKHKLVLRDIRKVYPPGIEGVYA